MGAAALTAVVGFVSGCGSYQLQGRVVPGARSTVSIVSADDPRLDAAGIGGATVQATIDPRSISPVRVGPTVTDADGYFVVPVDEFGAGVLEYDAQLVVRLKNHVPAVGDFPLPGRSKRVLVTLVPGDDRYTPEKTDIVEETMEMSKPYLNE